MRLRYLSVLALSLALSACPKDIEPGLIVEPEIVLEGQPIDIRLVGQTPDTVVTLKTEEIRMRRGKPTYYTSSADFRTDEHGTVELAFDAPIDGSYSGLDPAGLFWSRRRPDELQPVEDAELKPLTLSADVDGDGIADYEKPLQLVKAWPDIEVESFSDDFPGSVIARPYKGDNWPVLIVLGGSEGGDSTAKSMAPVFASHGYLTIGLPYYSPAWGNQPQAVPGLPKAFAEIPVDKIEAVINTLPNVDGANSDKIGIWGVSKGAEYALLAGSLIDGIDAIAAIVPSDVVWEGWGAGETVSSFSWRGEPLDFVPYKGVSEEYAKDNPEIRNFHDTGREAFPETVAPARIRVENIDEPVFLVGGDKDIVWASGPMSRTIKATRDEAGLETVMFVSETSGHGISGTGYAPDSEANAKLEGEAWPALLEFLETHLKN